MGSTYLTPEKSARAEQTIKRSRFIGLVHPVRSESEIDGAKRSAAREFPDATHVCSAYVLGDPGSAPSMRADDAGEPGGTAGRPVLNVLRQRNVGDAVLIVVRYFGGIKLGASGLVRAYAGTATMALDAADLVETVRTIEMIVRCAYEHESVVRRIATSHDATVQDVLYQGLVRFRLSVRGERADELRDQLRDASGGRIELEMR